MNSQYIVKHEVVSGGYFVPFAVYLNGNLVGRHYTEQEAQEWIRTRIGEEMATQTVGFFFTNHPSID